MDSDGTATAANLMPEKQFILTFATLPELWDDTNPFYGKKSKRTEALQKLLFIYRKMKVDATVGDVRNKINSLRSNYRRELKKISISKRSGSGRVYTPKSWTFHYLKFLNETEDSVSRTPTELVEAEYSDDSDSSEQQISNVSQKNVDFSAKNKVSKLSSLKTIKKRKSEQLTKQNKLLDQPCSFVSQLTDFNSLVIVWTEKLERLNATQRLFAEKAINDMLFEAELGNLHRHSVEINEPEETEAQSH